MFKVKFLCNAIEKNFKFQKLVPFCRSVKSFSRQDFQVKPYCTIMEEGLLDPPKTIQGMKVFDENAFKKTISVPTITVQVEYFNAVQDLLKKYYLKMCKLQMVKECIQGKTKEILLNPCIVQSWNDFDDSLKEKLEKNEISEKSFSNTQVELNLINWNASDLIKMVLSEKYSLSGYSLVGHIIHLNLSEEVMEYKYVIAEILLRKVPSARTVVNKKNTIDNVYRNFEMEVLCGEPNFIVCVRENNVRYQLDFSKVYWNPRLCTEHLRITDMITYTDVVFDVFAGVGPFSIPAALKKCKVFANDLNPESYKWLNHNITLNKRTKNYIQTYNKDGGDFIMTDAKDNLLKVWKDDYFSGKIYFLMNLPALAPTFIKCFKGLFNKNDLSDLKAEKVKTCLPTVFCYFFIKEAGTERQTFEQSSGLPLDNIEHVFFNVRDVAPSKWMIRLKFELPYHYLVAEDCSDLDEPLPKKLCTS